ncbi:hypothetical protein B0H13DRAFT_2379500 [Mycena leptocephala]|nr:hypothetical protein B0H13DRAFT_2379500 [Mycena leptocephala]
MAQAITQASTNVPVHRGTRLVQDLPPLACWAALEEVRRLQSRKVSTQRRPSQPGASFSTFFVRISHEESPHFVVHLAIKAILANGTVFVQAAAVSASPSSDTT